MCYFRNLRMKSVSMSIIYPLVSYSHLWHKLTIPTIYYIGKLFTGEHFRDVRRLCDIAVSINELASQCNKRTLYDKSFHQGEHLNNIINSNIIYSI